MPSPLPGNVVVDHADKAAREATLGALNGAIKWGLASAVGAVGMYFVSPLFRSLTIQFRVYIWMCPTTLGSMLEADHRLRRYEARLRLEKRNRLDSAREQALEEEMAEVNELERRGREKEKKKMGEEARK